MSNGARGADRTVAQPIDHAHLDRLATRFGAHFLIQLIDLFISQGKDRMALAERGALERDGGAILSAAHAFKSSAGNLGAGPLGTIASEIERRGHGGASVEILVQLVANLSEAFASTCEALAIHREQVVRRTPSE
jgi:HPt (histidine-containing phosphotransfer) domain-containing protein